MTKNSLVSFAMPYARLDVTRKAKMTILDAAEGVCRVCGYRTASVAVAGCPDCGGPIVPAGRRNQAPRLSWRSLPPMRYQRPYAWFVVLSALDVLFTWTVLLCGGQEVNAIADAVIGYAGAQGIVAYKFCLVVLVIVLCEVIGRRRDKVGKKLAEWSVAITSIPIVLSIYQLLTA